MNQLNILKLRQELGLTQEDFAAMVGVTWRTVSRWENNKGYPSKLARAAIKNLMEKNELNKNSRNE